MKKRMITILLTAAIMASMLVVPAEAAVSKFSDVSDSYTATAVETLRLMGVIDGYPNGSFQPDGSLTRAQFCKMAVYAMDGSKELGRYTAVTIFPDVKPSHWAADCVNMAAKKGLIAGFEDGRFKPNQTITSGQAVTILLRVLGYRDADIGGIWPESYMALAKTIGLTDATGITSGRAVLTRAQAAKLFMNLLQTDTAAGGTLFTLSETVTLSGVDGGRGTMTAGGTTYDMVKPVMSSTLVGSQGKVVLAADGKKALTFLPVTNNGKGVSNAAVIIYADRDSSGLSALAGTTNYSIFKNGLPASTGDLRKNDVAIYSAATNSVIVCDTRVTVYYEDCKPSPAAPTTVMALGGTEFSVLPTAMDSVAKFKPGKTMTLLLTADGQIAAAVEPMGGSNGGNAVGIVDHTGKVALICGNGTMELALKDISVDAKYYGQLVRVSSGSKGQVGLSILSGGASGDLDVGKKTLGGKELSDQVKVFEAGDEITLGELNTSIVKQSQISYVRTNWAGQVDLIVLNGGQTGTVIYGFAKVHVEKNPDTGEVLSRTVEVISGSGETTGAIDTAHMVKNGEYVCATMKNGRFTSIVPLNKMTKVSNSSWIGSSAVVYGGRTYTVAANVPCYNANTGRWMTLDEARAYSDVLNLYMQDQIVRIVEIKD